MDAGSEEAAVRAGGEVYISPATWSFCPIFLAIILIYYKNSKTPIITQFGALAGQVQHMAAQKVGFTSRLLGQVALAGKFQVQLHWNLHIRAELETCQLGDPYPRSTHKLSPSRALANPHCKHYRDIGCVYCGKNEMIIERTLSMQHGHRVSHLQNSCIVFMDIYGQQRTA